MERRRERRGRAPGRICSKALGLGLLEKNLGFFTAVLQAKVSSVPGLALGQRTPQVLNGRSA